MKEKDKKAVVVTCIYPNDGKDAAEIIKESFAMYIKSEIAKENK